MKITKRCAYCATCYNLFPTVLVTPLYTNANAKDWPVFTKADMLRKLDHVTRNLVIEDNFQHWTNAGFRVALKFWTFHLGLEIHYGS